MRTFSSLTKTLIFGEKRKTVPANEETENVSNVFSRKGESHKVLSPRGQSCMFLFLFLPSPPPLHERNLCEKRRSLDVSPSPGIRRANETSRDTFGTPYRDKSGRVLRA